MVMALVTAAIGMAFAGGAAATTAESDYQLDGTDEVEGFAAADDENDTVIYETDLNSDSVADFEELTLEIAYENNTLVEYDVDDAEITGDDDDATPLELEWTVEHADLEKLPGDAGEVTVADATITELEDAEEAEAVETADEIEYEFDSTHAVRTAFSTDDDIVSEFEASDDDDGMFSSLAFWSSSDDIATIEDDIGIDGDNTNVTVYSEDSGITDAFDAELEDADDGDRVGYLMTSNLDDGIVYVFASEPGEKIGGDDVDEDDTYIVAHEGGEYEINLGDNYEGEETASLSLTAGEKFDRSALQDDLDYSLTQAWGLDMDSMFSLDNWVDTLTFW
ncbi:hypothetical protein [Natronorubrum texcoconense]|uniref:Uncharacterized protein n=1 Tax=Natronorubrum texcoconense TaxID=1095776 RepID=A0A1G9H7B3_9EURY|nr:hypothetical protein [Natronorubrum texcoconense]SDL08850.1 hypothetical protein SAMN04515672_0133 [Natronorubrum texcoconense]